MLSEVMRNIPYPSTSVPPDDSHSGCLQAKPPIQLSLLCSHTSESATNKKVTWKNNVCWFPSWTFQILEQNVYLFPYCCLQIDAVTRFARISAQIHAKDCERMSQYTFWSICTTQNAARALCHFPLSRCPGQLQVRPEEDFSFQSLSLFASKLRVSPANVKTQQISTNLTLNSTWHCAGINLQWGGVKPSSF